MGLDYVSSVDAVNATGESVSPSKYIEYWHMSDRGFRGSRESRGNEGGPYRYIPVCPHSDDCRR